MNELKFISKMDKKFKGFFIGFAIFIILFFIFIAILDGATISKADWLTLIITMFVVILFVAWLLVDIRYVLREDHLYIRGGFLFTKIKYEDIEGYRLFNSFLEAGSGFNVLSSTKGVAILSQKVLLGEVKISPSNREQFIEELDKRRKASHANLASQSNTQ